MGCRRQLFDDIINERDEFAPAKAFVFGAIVSGIAGLIVSLAVDPRDLRLLAAVLAGTTFFGGGCFAIFLVPDHVFRRTCHGGIHLLAHAPWKILLGLGFLGAIILVGGLFSMLLGAIGGIYGCYSLFVLFIRTRKNFEGRRPMWRLWKSETRDFLSRLRRSGLLDDAAIRQARKSVPNNAAGKTKLDKLCSRLVENGSITQWHCDHLRAGRFKGFFADNYKLIDRVGGDLSLTYIAVDINSGQKVRLRYSNGHTKYQVLDL